MQIKMKVWKEEDKLILLIKKRYKNSQIKMVIERQ